MLGQGNVARQAAGAAIAATVSAAGECFSGRQKIGRLLKTVGAEAVAEKIVMEIAVITVAARRLSVAGTLGPQLAGYSKWGRGHKRMKGPAIWERKCCRTWLQQKLGIET